MSAFTSLPASFPTSTEAERALLLDWIRGTSLVYGPWKGFKKLYKDVETAYANGQRDNEVLAALIARLDLVTLDKEPNAKGAFPPVLAGSFNTAIVEGDLLYAIQDSTSLVVYDLSNPLEPREIFRWSPPPTAKVHYHLLWIEGKRLIFGGGANLRAFDLTDPRIPRYVGKYNPGSFNSAAVVGDFIYAADYQSLKVFQMEATGQSSFVQQSNLPLQYSYNLTAKPGLVAVSHYSTRNYAISFIDVSNPSAPTVASQISSQNPNAWKFVGDSLLRIDREHLVFTDLSRPEKPREISRFRIEGAQSFHLRENTVFVACQSWQPGQGYQTKIRIVDISQPHSPRLIGEFETGAHLMASYGDLLYLVGNGIRILDVSDLSRPQPVGQRPKNATFAYLKRRNRRLLRTLAQADGDAFVALSSAVLKEAGAGHDALDLASQWVSAELVLAGGSWRQTSHGRGGYIQDKKFVLKRREERAPEAWDSHLETARELWNHPHLPWQTQEMALKILLGHGEAVSPSSPAQLTRFLWSDSPFAQLWAARQTRKRLAAGENVEARALAPLLWLENPTRRRTVLEYIERNLVEKSVIATHLASLLGLNAPGGLSRRVRDIALLLAARFDLSDRDFSADGAFRALPVLLSSGEAPIRAVALGFCRRLSASLALEALSLLPNIAAANRDTFISALCESASSGELPVEKIDALLRHAEASIREATWKLVEASQTSNQVFKAIWIKLFIGLRRESVYEGDRYRSLYLGERWIESIALQTAVNSDAALAVLARCGLSRDEVVPRFGPNFYSGSEQNKVSPAIWGAYSLFLPPAQVVETIIKAPEWAAWRDAWVRANAPHPQKLADFWNSVQEFLSGNADEEQKQILRARTFEQGSVAATFGGAASQLSPALLLTLIGAVPENLWLEWRTSLLTTLQSDPATREAFWSAARISSALEGGFLRARLIDDPDFAATFGLLELDALEADNPAFTSLILAWLQTRESSLGRDGWLEAAVHPLPAVRDLGLNHLEVIGLDVPGALKLLESKLPPSIDFGQRWFERQTENNLELALALSDSPQPTVRAFGRTYIAARLESLMQSGLIAYLQDNPNAEMQSFVAAQLKEQPEAAVPEFDRAVLRGRYRARRAKNLVQERRTTSVPLPDDKTLLELARGRTPRDSEWALTQLARRALDGAVVADVEVGKVAGI
jgi:hypothetical protein